MSEDAIALLLKYNLSLDPAINYNLESIFQKTSGWGAKGEVKRIHKTIVPVEPLLKRLLQQGEEVLYVARGVQYKFSEQYFLGMWANLINQTVFVLTNVRLLMFHVNTKGIPQHTNWLIYFNQIKKFKGSMFGSVSLHLIDGTKLNFSGFKGVDRKRMPACFEEAMQAYTELGFNPTATQSRENLCSKCLIVVPKDVYQCSACSQVFWKPMDVALRSLIFPSWGDFTLKHTGLAIIELLGYCFTWFIFVMVFLGILAEEGVGGAAVAAAVFAVILGFQHCVDAALTYYIAKKGVHPKGPVT
jgi:hypothetical protein